MAARLTIRDIARRAGVSTATVSRVLNEEPDVCPRTRQRIQRIQRLVAERGDATSAADAGRVGGRTGLIGVLVPSLSWAIMSPILRGAAAAVERTSRELALYSLGRKRDRVEIVQRIVDAKLLDGLIAIYPDGVASSGDDVDGEGRVSERLRQLRERGLPVVIVDDQAAHDDLPWISPDNRQGAMEAVRHLVALGHRRIAHVAGPAPYLCSRERLEGYRAALREARLAPERALEVAGDFTASGGWAAALRLLALPEPPTAVFAANDDMARGVLTAVRQHGLRAPEDMAVVGFDDAGCSATTAPPLTTIRQPFFDTGWWAATTLMESIATARAPSEMAPPRPAHIELPVELVQRLSTAALGTAAGMGG